MNSRAGARRVPQRKIPTMNDRGEASGQTWDVTVKGLPLHVQLVPYEGPLWAAPSSFRVGRRGEAVMATRGISMGASQGS